MSDFTFKRTPPPWYNGPFKIRLTDNRGGEFRDEDPDGPEQFRDDFLLLLRYEVEWRGACKSEVDPMELRHHLCDAPWGFGIRFGPNDTENLVLEWDITVQPGQDKGANLPTEGVKRFVERLCMGAGAATVEHELHNYEAAFEPPYDPSKGRSVDEVLDGIWHVQ